jgi:CXXX repeat peptide maturase
MEPVLRAPVGHLLVLLEQGAVPFCSYENPHFYSAAAPRWIPEPLLADAVALARRQDLALTFLFGKTRPPARLERLLESVAHSKIVPAALERDYPGAIVVLDADAREDFSALHDSLDRNLILRLARPKGAAQLVETLLGKFRRLSLHFTAVEYFTEADTAIHEEELSRIAKLLAAAYRSGGGPEVNVLSDRLMLKTMRNCGAGVDHLTLAPNGRLYICPGFYHDDETAAVADFDNKKAPDVLPALELRRAPLCSRCDAFHCKRCIYLNAKTTLEFKVPSEQQCAVAHVEREASRRLLVELGQIEPFRRMPRIPELMYRDPLECIDLPPRTGDPASDPNL